MKQIILTILMAVTIIGLSSCNSSPNENTSDAQEYTDVRLRLVEQARWAMTAHNMQAWEIELSDEVSGEMILFLDTGRLLAATDPYSRQTVMSLGAFLAVLEDQVISEGVDLQFTLFPEGTLPEDDPGADFLKPVAVINLTTKSVFCEENVLTGLDALSSATVKSGLKNDVDGLENLINDVRSSVKPEQLIGVEIDVFPTDSPEELKDLKNLLIEAFAIEMKTESTLKESYTLMRKNPDQIQEKPFGLSYGSSFDTGGLGIIEFFETWFPGDLETWGKTGAEMYEKQIRALDHYFFIRTVDNSRESQIYAGMLLERVWQQLRLNGLAFIPASQALQEYSEMDVLYSKVHRDYADAGETIQMIGAVGKVEGSYRKGFRLPVDQILR